MRDLVTGRLQLVEALEVGDADAPGVDLALKIVLFAREGGALSAAERGPDQHCQGCLQDTSPRCHQNGSPPRCVFELRGSTGLPDDLKPVFS